MRDTRQQAFDRITDLPLTRTTRNEQVQFFHFGSMHYKTPQGLILDVGELTLALNCPWQLQQADGATITDKEVFLRKRETGLPSPKFDWKVPGANLRDQRLMELINQGAALVVERTEQLPDQGFRIDFANHCTLTVTLDPAKADTAFWQLFSNTGDNLKVGAGATV